MRDSLGRLDSLLYAYSFRLPSETLPQHPWTASIFTFMAASLGQAIASIQRFDYASLVVISAVVYDYTLTFAQEMEYIWSKPWTGVSTLFVIARYLGLCSVIIHSLCEILFLFQAWCFWTFMCAADLVMILRLWALYDRSRLILGTLLAFFAMQIVAYFAAYVMFSAQFPDSIQAGAAQVLDYSLCIFGSISTIEDEVLDAIQIAFGALMCLLVTIRFVKESLQMCKATKQFKVNRYTRQLARDGIVYFVAILLFALMNVLGNTGDIAPGWQLVLATAIQQIPPFTLIPRFILDLRELYAHDLQARRGSHIDTAFGLGSQPWHVAPVSLIMPSNEQDEDEHSDETEESPGDSPCA